MKVDLSVTAARRLSVGLIGLALIGSGAVASTPAQAMTRSATQDSAKTCLEPAKSAANQRATTWREGADTDQVSAAVKARVDAVLASTTPGASSLSARAAALPAKIHVPVYIHIIHGTHRGEHRITKRKARRMFYILRAGYNGDQAPGAMAPTGVVFDFRKITINRNDKWFHASPFTRYDRQMKTRLHRGRAQALNIYVNRPKSRGGLLLLGFSTFPWQRANHPKLDSVTVSEAGLPGGRARGYNLGDTVIHETGHWLGLLHTFEGGCAGSGDGVADTPSEASPSFTCPIGRNTCPDPDLPPVPPSVDPTPQVIPDPVQNFMDYSYDTCMNNFTPDQTVRMKTAFMAYRAGR